MDNSKEEKESSKKDYSIDEALTNAATVGSIGGPVGAVAGAITLSQDINITYYKQEHTHYHQTVYVSKATENVTEDVNDNPVTTTSNEENNSISDEARENDAAIEKESSKKDYSIDEATKNAAIVSGFTAFGGIVGGGVGAIAGAIGGAVILGTCTSKETDDEKGKTAELE